MDMLTLADISINDLIDLWGQVGSLSTPTLLVGLIYALWKEHIVLGPTHKKKETECDTTLKARDLCLTELGETKITLAETKVRLEVMTPVKGGG